MWRIELILCKIKQYCRVIVKTRAYVKKRLASGQIIELFMLGIELV